jgi:hypothetical protein
MLAIFGVEFTWNASWDWEAALVALFFSPISMDDSSYRRNFDPGKEERNPSPQVERAS